MPKKIVDNNSLPTIKLVTLDCNSKGCNPDTCMPDVKCSPDSEDCGPVWD